jgi:hypothetical protein
MREWGSDIWTKVIESATLLILPFKMPENLAEYALNSENENVGITCDILNMSSTLRFLCCNV